jgi:SAM-dependent methyltransferase
VDYVRYRPDYPSAAIDAVLRGLPEPSRLAVADVGAGTGISARPLADRGARVIAVEPNEAMRASASPHDGVEWRDGTAEATGLRDASVDLVLCAQAFHWFRQRDALAEFHRILRPGARLALLWNSRDRSDDFTRGYTEAIQAVSGEHPAERREFDPGVIHQDGWFTPAVLEVWPHRQELNRDGLIGRAVSASYVPREGARLEALTRLLTALVERYRDSQGLVCLRYATKLYLSERR